MTLKLGRFMIVALVAVLAGCSSKGGTTDGAAAVEDRGTSADGGAGSETIRSDLTQIPHHCPGIFRRVRGRHAGACILPWKITADSVGSRPDRDAAPPPPA